MMKFFLLMTTVFVFQSPAFAESKKEIMQKKASEAVDATADYTASQKEEFQKSMEEKLTSVKTEISDLKKNIGNKSEDVQKTFKTRLADLEDKRIALQKDLNKLKHKSGKAWNHMKTGLSSAWDDFTNSYEKAKNEYKEKNQ